MLRKILFLIITGMFGFSCSSLLWAGSADAASLANTPSMSEETAPVATPAQTIAPDEDTYLIGPGDLLDIAVWRDENLTRSCVVRPDGFISFPLIGNVMAAGKTASHLKSEMENRLSRYVPGVNLSLDIKQVNSLIIYVIGKVNNPGRFILNIDADVLQALAMAGGVNVFAKRNDIKIFRQGSDETTIFPFEYDQVVDGKRLEQNIHLKRGDVVVIP